MMSKYTTPIFKGLCTHINTGETKKIYTHRKVGYSTDIYFYRGRYNKVIHINDNEMFGANKVWFKFDEYVVAKFIRDTNELLIETYPKLSDRRYCVQESKRYHNVLVVFDKGLNKAVEIIGDLFIKNNKIGMYLHNTHVIMYDEAEYITSHVLNTIAEYVYPKYSDLVGQVIKDIAVSDNSVTITTESGQTTINL